MTPAGILADTADATALSSSCRGKAAGFWRKSAIKHGKNDITLNVFDSLLPCLMSRTTR